MQVTLRGVSGPGTAVAAVLREGVPFSVGRTDRATLPIAGDTFLSSLHFGIDCRDGGVLLRDMDSSNGTFVNGLRVKEQALFHGDSIAAGGSVFQLEIESGEQQPRDLVELLSAQPEPLYAVLDAARDPKIHDLLLTSGAEYCSLYQGKLAAALEHVAPYLVYLPPRSPLLQQIVAQGWSKAWGIFLTCNQPLDAVRHQLRRSLMVTLEENQENVYFRFYDPRVLRIFLPITDPKQLAEFGGPISSFLMEDEKPEILLRFYPAGGQIKLEKVGVSVPGRGSWSG